MNLRPVSEVLPNTRVILRMDLDVPMEDGLVTDPSRLSKTIPTIRLLLDNNCKVAIIGHRGRPTGKDEELTLRGVYLELMMLLEPNGENMIDSVFLEDFSNRELIDQSLANNQIVFFENLRFWEGEEKNDPEFLTNLIEVSQYFVNDAFAVAHRRAASIMLHQKMPGFYGFSFVDEAKKIGSILENPERPLTIILGGAKEDKLKYLEILIERADRVLIGGKLPIMTQQTVNDKVTWAELRDDKLDLSDDDIKKFIEIINNSKTIIWAGAMGLYEEENSRKGTEEIARAVAGLNGFKVVAGGDTGAAMETLGLKNNIDLICSGGGVMLEMIGKGTLPAWE